MIHTQAQKLVDDCNIEDFKSAVTWCYCFMTCNGLYVHTKTELTQKMALEYEEKFCDSAITGF
jgi:hypothetical protein